MNLSMRIRRARQHLGISQSELARRMKLHRSCVGHWEGVAKANPGPDRLADLARICGISYEWLATGRGSMRLQHDPLHDIPAVFGKLVDDPQALRLLRAWDALSVRSRAVVLEMSEQLAAQRKPRRTNSNSVIKLTERFVDRDSGDPV